MGRFDATINRFKLQSDDPGLGKDIIVDFSVPASPAKQPIMGDWDGNGTDTVGLYSSFERMVFLRNSNTSGPSEWTYSFDPFGASCSFPIPIAVAGDWDGNGVDTPGLYCPSSATFCFRDWDTCMSIVAPQCDAGGCMPVAGDWDADGIDTPGLYNRFTGEFYLARAIVMGSPYDTVTFTPPGFSNMLPLASQWDRGRMDSVGLFDASTSTFHIAPSEVDPKEETVVYGTYNDGVALAGNWNGLLSNVPPSSKWGVTFDGLIANSYLPGNLGRSLFDRVHEMGAGWVRLALYWDAIERVQGQFDWSATDKAVNDITAAGLNIYGNINWAPAWAASTPCCSLPLECPNYTPFWCMDPTAAYDPTKCGCLDGPPPDTAKFTAFVTTVVKRYPAIRYWGFWNEPAYDPSVGHGIFWHSAEHIEDAILRPGYVAAKAADPNVIVVGPEMDPPSTTAQTQLGRILVADAASRFLDVISVHSYGDWVSCPNGQVMDILSNLDIWRGMITPQIQAGRPIWCSEFGIIPCNSSFSTSCPAGSDARQRALVVDVLQGIDAPARDWVDKAVVYGAGYAGNAEENYQQFFHCLYDPTTCPNGDGLPRPEYWGMGNLLLGRKPVADFTGSPRGGVAPLQVAFADRSLYAPESYVWSFGDTSTLTCPNVFPACDPWPTCTQVDHTYKNPGLYTVSMTASDPVGGSTATKANYVLVCDPAGFDVPFTATPMRGTAPLQVQFACPYPGTYKWDFGDGCGPSCDTEQDPIHTYRGTGVYNITLTFDGGGGCTSTVTKYGLIEVVGSFPPNLVTGPGANQANAPRSRGFTVECAALPCDVEPAPADFLAYGASQWGVNVAQLEMRPGHPGDILTGAGPGPAYGPQVRGFRPDGSSIAKVNFYAYSTLRYGVNVIGGDVDGDGLDEMVTGAGPGSVFGPHVRGFNFDGGTRTAIQKISYFAYGTLKYGVNVGTSALDFPTPARDRLLTGPGPGASFGTTVRGWRYDDVAIDSKDYIPKVNFNAFAATGYGVNVAGGDLDGVAGEDIIAGMPPGPTKAYASQVAGFGVDLPGTGVKPYDVSPLISPVFQTLYGVNVGTGSFDVTLPWRAQAVVGQGPDPAAVTFVRGIYADTSDPSNPPVLTPLPGFLFNAYGPEQYKFGAKVGGRIRHQLPQASDGLEPTDALMRVARESAADIPISTTPCDSCDPKLGILAGTGWGDDAQLQKALEKWDTLLDVLPSLAYPWQVVQILDDILALVGDPVKGITNELARVELSKQIAEIRASYDPPRFPSNAVTGFISGIEEPSNMALSVPTGKLFVDPDPVLPPPPPPPPPAAPAVVHVVDVGTLSQEEDRVLPQAAGTRVSGLWAPTGRSEVYALVTTPKCADEACTPGGQGGGGAPPSLDGLALARLAPIGTLPVDAGFIALPSIVTGSPTPLYVSPPSGATALLPDTAYLGLDVVTSPAGWVGSLVLMIQGVRDFDTVSGVVVAAPSPGYVAFAESPDASVPALADRLYAAGPNGIDAIATKATPPALVSNALVLPWGFGEPTAMTSGETAGGANRVWVAAADTLAAYEPASGNMAVLSCAIPGGGAVAVHLSLDGRFVLVTRHPGGTATTLAVFDADTLDFIRDSSMTDCGGGPCSFSSHNPMALTIDGSHAFVSNPENDLLDYVYIQPARLVVTASALSDVIAAVPPEEWKAPGAQQALLQETGTVQTLLGNAEKVPPGPAQEALLRNADAKLSQMMTKYDGCGGSNKENDLVSDCDEQASMTSVSTQLQAAIQGQLPPALPKP